MVGVIIFIGIIGCFRIINTSNQQPIDMISLNSIAKQAARNWTHLEQLKEEAFPYEYIIFDPLGEMIFSNSNREIDSIESAIRERQSCVNIIEEGKFLGTVVVITNSTESMQHQKKQLVKVILGIALLQGILILIYTIKTYAQVLRPFKKLQDFAQEVARGNLDIPLEMDNGNVFGSFTESFDMMREELKLARKKEYEANESKKEFIASLSHDIKTPVTGIKLISELLALQIEKPELKEKVNTIYHKAEQINELVTELFESTLEELGELKVEPKDEYAVALSKLFKEMDYEGVIIQGDIPECMIYMDLARMRQIISNIVSNSYKYAGTPIHVTYTSRAGYLQVDIKDCGRGVPADELPLIFNKFYRSKEESIQKKVGAGLGLYISKTLIEKMGGEISGFNQKDGFVVRLLVPLSCAGLNE